MFKLLSLLFGLLTGYFALRWIPAFDPNNITTFLTTVLFNPIMVFLGLISFLLSFIALSKSVSDFIKETFIFLKRGQMNVFNWLSSLPVVVIFCFFISLDVWISLFLICFTLIYGIISVDLSSSLDKSKIEIEN